MTAAEWSLRGQESTSLGWRKLVCQGSGDNEPTAPRLSYRLLDAGSQSAGVVGGDPEGQLIAGRGSIIEGGGDAMSGSEMEVIAGGSFVDGAALGLAG